MKNLLLIICLSSFFSVIKAQDIIINIKDDTTKCKINAVDSFNIYLTIKRGDYFYDSYIDRKQVKAYYYNVYSTTPKVSTAADWHFPKVRLNFNGCTGKLLSDAIPPVIGDLTDADKKRYDNLRWGRGFGADVDLYIFRFLGIGAKYNYFSSTTNIDENFHETYKYYYIGPSLCFQGIMYNKTAIAHLCLTGGKMFINHFKSENSTTDLGDGNIITVRGDHTITGETYAYGGTIGFDFLFDSQIALGIESTCLYAQFKKFKLKSNVDNKNETFDIDGLKFNVLRLDINIGIKLYL